jgi:hypothetical protein
MTARLDIMMMDKGGLDEMNVGEEEKEEDEEEEVTCLSFPQFNISPCSF